MDANGTYFIDLSHQNSEFNWDKLNPSIKGVILKATQGATYKDATFLPHLNKVRSKGLILGAYHFLNFTDTAEVQAANYLSRGVDFSHPGTLPPIVDIENQVGSTDVESANLDKHVYNNPKDSAKLISDFLAILKDKTGRTPIIYTYNGFWTPTLHSPDFSDCPLWVANYTPNEPKPFSGWETWSIWQYSTRGSYIADHDNGDVDWSIVNPIIDLKQLANL